MTVYIVDSFLTLYTVHIIVIALNAFQSCNTSKPCYLAKCLGSDWTSIAFLYCNIVNKL